MAMDKLSMADLELLAHTSTPPVVTAAGSALFASVVGSQTTRALTFQAPGQVRIEDRSTPELQSADDAVVRIDATGVCGSDLHIYHGRLKIESASRSGTSAWGR